MKRQNHPQLPPIETQQTESSDFRSSDVCYSNNNGISPTSLHSLTPSPTLSLLSPLSQSQVFDYKGMTQAKLELDRAMELLGSLSVSKTSASSSAIPTLSPTSSTPSRAKVLETAKNSWVKKLGEVEWPSILDSLSSPSRTREESSLYARLLARRLPVKQYVFFELLTPSSYLSSPGVDKGCSACDCKDETIEVRSSFF
jgi:hypothetical protein